MKLILILLAFITLSGCSTWFKNYSRTWWTGTAHQIVCKQPYYDNADCNTLAVKSYDGEIYQIEFPNGDYLLSYDWECVQAADIYNFDQFCTMWDENDEEWDIMPPGSIFTY